MEDKYIKGTPPMVMLPAKNYIFKDNGKIVEITLPIRGSYHDIDPTFFPEDAGEFNIFDEETKTIYLPGITKILFAASKYPHLEFNQFFIVLSIKFKDEEFVLRGQILDMMLATKSEEPQIEEE